MEHFFGLRSDEVTSLERENQKAVRQIAGAYGAF